MRRAPIYAIAFVVAFVCGVVAYDVRNPNVAEASGVGGAAVNLGSYVGNAGISGNLGVSGTLGVTGAATLRSTLAVTSTSTLTGNVAMGGTCAVTGALSATGALSTASTLAVTGVATLSSDLNVTGNAAVTGTLGVTGAATLRGGLTETGAWGLSGTGTVTGATTFTSTITLSPTSGNSITTTAGLAQFGAGLRLSKLTTGQTAHAGGGQASAVVVTTGLNEFTVVGTAGDSARLFANTNPGEFAGVCNATATSMNLFPPSTGNINGLAQDAAMAVPATKCTFCYVLTSTRWGCTTP